jgi:hypothetical protein
MNWEGFWGLYCVFTGVLLAPVFFIAGINPHHVQNPNITHPLGFALTCVAGSVLMVVIAVIGAFIYRGARRYERTGSYYA